MFTEREKEMLDLIVSGYTNNEMADILGISVHTVKSHKENIFFKLDVHNSVQAAVKYLQMNK